MQLQPHPTIPPCDGPVLVCILDGFGENEVKDEYNAVHAASTPVCDKLRELPGRWRTIKVREGWEEEGERGRGPCAPPTQTRGRRRSRQSAAPGTRLFRARAPCLPSAWRETNRRHRVQGSGERATVATERACFSSSDAQFLTRSPFSLLPQAHGRAVGLPSDDDMGNSEVGHNALGE